MSPRTVGGDASDGNDASTVRTLITGMSAVGKSSVISELIKLRHRAIDLDTDEWSQLAPDDSANAYGKNPAELRRELQLRTVVEPLLRRSACLEIDTSRHPVASVIAVITNHVAAGHSG